ncbi:hypothetical protein FF38_06183 [Lucilia cuprina]|uniref:Heparanase n=1 Tax=Lucilia cuprina TaxID=7375 RepID=A0A0L0C6M5_LUCCU|nr:Inactive heparanase-2 [Lucilia cuprina]KNC27920.1 hypothetical protein FF38_06183 [Lucilia cuprina]
MSWLRSIFFYAGLLLFAHYAIADVIVQLNINRPIYDVSDKFISFSIKPEDLYKALDGSNRKTITRMASMLSHSHVKFVGDFYFASKTEGIRLRNPTKIVWKGFNKWTKAVNWSMIIPVPYKPDNWDAMQALKILNTSHMVGIDEAIWQLGTDFGTSRAADYASELKTFNLMVESFRQTVTNWQTMGADISAGSSPDETKRYVELSRDLNVAYGWIQSGDMFSSVGSAISDRDPALKVLFKSNVPVWLSLPKKKVLSTHLDDEVLDGLSWAQTMGDAANVGFESIFKTLSLDDLEKPKYGFYVTALFKKIMGSRVYPARPLGVYGRNNKLYTHCANMVSGGLAFMVVNKQELPLQIAIRSMNRLQDSEVWQYALTMSNGHVMLNNKKLSVNSTLIPEIRRKHTKSMLQLKTPGMSVSFWVLPNANLEHCQFTEVETPIVPAEETNQKIKRYSSTDRLLKELIKESAKPPLSPLASLISRHRRSVDNEDRFKRFVLEGNRDEVKPLTNFAENIVQEMKSPLKRDIFSPDRRISALNWLGNIFKEPFSLDLPLLKRNARQSDTYTGPFFMTRDGKKTAFTKKITEIRKPEKKVNKLPPEDQEFDEEKFFKNVGVQPEPDYVRVPEGDVFLSKIASLDGDETEEELKIETKKSNKAKTKTKEIVSEMKPLRLLPTEFFEALPANPIQPVANKLNIGSALNSLLFSDPFGKKYGKSNKNAFAKNFDLKEDPITTEIVEPEIHKDLDIDTETNDGDDFEQAQIDITQKALKKKVSQEEVVESKEKDVDDLLDAGEEKTLEKTKPLYSNNLNLFGDSSKGEAEEELNADTKSVQTDSSTKSKFDEIPWWDLSNTRLKRSLDTRYPADSWRNNMISKDEDPITAADEMSPIRLRHFEHKVEEVVRSTNNKNNKNDDDNDDDGSIGKRIVKTFKEQVTKLVDIFSQHVSEWYNTLTKQLDSPDENTTEGNRIA